MSSDLSQFPQYPPDPHRGPYGIEVSEPAFPVSPSPLEWIASAALFLATFLSTTFAGLVYAVGDAGFRSMVLTAAAHPRILIYGLPFSFTFLSILLAHEFGHFFACRYYGIRCTPPYFIPFPITIAGTLGAFIRIKSPFQNKRALFDVGIAGPLAGFAFVLPSLMVGIANSRLVPRGAFHGGIYFGEPLLFRWLGKLLLGYSPQSQDMMAHPIAMAAWFGLLATCINLLPIWQLDGGHIAYAIFGREIQKKLSVVGVIALIAVSFVGWPLPSYLAFGLLLLILGLRYRFFHPPTLYDADGVGPIRLALALLAVLILVVSFTPVPVSLS